MQTRDRNSNKANNFSKKKWLKRKTAPTKLTFLKGMMKNTLYFCWWLPFFLGFVSDYMICICIKFIIFPFCICYTKWKILSIIFIVYLYISTYKCVCTHMYIQYISRNAISTRFYLSKKKFKSGKYGQKWKIKKKLKLFGNSNQSETVKGGQIFRECFWSLILSQKEQESARLDHIPQQISSSVCFAAQK